MAASDRRCRLLLVEGDAHTRRTLVRLLAREYDVYAVADEAEALAAGSDFRADVVVASVDAPQTGEAAGLMRELRDRHGAPGVAVTSYTVDDDADLLKAGFVTWLTKPIRFGDLLRAIGEAAAVVAVETSACAASLPPSAKEPPAQANPQPAAPATAAATAG